MKISALLKIIHARKFTIIIDGTQPKLRGNPDEATPTLMEAIRIHRNGILMAMGFGIGESPEDSANDVECYFPGNEKVSQRWYREVGWPIGAYFYRRVGSEDWLPIPGRLWNPEEKTGIVTSDIKPAEVLEAHP